MLFSMAEDPWKRFREREDERDAQESIRPETTKKPEESHTLVDGMEEAQKLIEHVNALYNQYLSGAINTPPSEKRRVLDRMMLTLSRAPKYTPTVNFKWGSVNASYNLHKEKWDRQLKALENGKIKRPQRKSG